MNSAELIEELTVLTKRQAEIIQQQAEVILQHEAMEQEKGGAENAMV